MYFCPRVPPPTCRSQQTPKFRGELTGAQTTVTLRRSAHCRRCTHETHTQSHVRRRPRLPGSGGGGAAMASSPAQTPLYLAGYGSGGERTNQGPPRPRRRRPPSPELPARNPICNSKHTTAASPSASNGRPRILWGLDGVWGLYSLDSLGKWEAGSYAEKGKRGRGQGGREPGLFHCIFARLRTAFRAPCQRSGADDGPVPH